MKPCRLWTIAFALGVSLVGVNTGPDDAQAAGFKSPEECLAYSGDAHLNCLYAYIEIQAGKIAKLEEQLQAKSAKAERLRAKLETQRAMAESIQNRLDAERRYQDYGLRVSPSFGFSYYSGAPFYPFYPYGPYGRSRHHGLLYGFGLSFGYPCYGCW